MSARPPISCPTNGLPARRYCEKGGAIYYLEPASGTIFQADMPTVGAMNQYADDEYVSGVYLEYAKSREPKAATTPPRSCTLAHVFRIVFTIRASNIPVIRV